MYHVRTVSTYQVNQHTQQPPPAITESSIPVTHADCKFGLLRYFDANSRNRDRSNSAWSKPYCSRHSSKFCPTLDSPIHTPPHRPYYKLKHATDVQFKRDWKVCC